MFILDTKRNENFYVLMKDGKEYLRISRRANKLEVVIPRLIQLFGNVEVI